MRLHRRVETSRSIVVDNPSMPGFASHLMHTTYLLLMVRAIRWLHTYSGLHIKFLRMLIYLKPVDGQTRIQMMCVQACVRVGVQCTYTRAYIIVCAQNYVCAHSKAIDCISSTTKWAWWSIENACMVTRPGIVCNVNGKKPVQMERERGWEMQLTKRSHDTRLVCWMVGRSTRQARIINYESMPSYQQKDKRKFKPERIKYQE